MLSIILHSLHDLLTTVAKHCRLSDNIWCLDSYKQRDMYMEKSQLWCENGYELRETPSSETWHLVIWQKVIILDESYYNFMVSQRRSLHEVPMYYAKLIICHDRSVSSNGQFIFHRIHPHSDLFQEKKGFTRSSFNLFIISVLAKFGDVTHDVIFDPLTSFYKTRKLALLVSHTVTTRFFSCVRLHSSMPENYIAFLLSLS